MISLILSGGVGSRLWPISREKLPKQFSPLLDQCLFSITAKRLEKLGEVQVCTSEQLRTLTLSAVRNDELNVSEVYHEPVGRNTAPAIALVCHMLNLQGRADEILGVYPSDHWIEKETEFVSAMKLAQQCAEQGQVVTIGIQPNHPATGFGYVDCQTDVFAKEGRFKAHKVKGFREKPDFETAEKYIKAGHYYWNSGMFVFKVSTMIDAFKKHMPEMWQMMEALKADLSNLDEVYGGLPKQSIDYGIMEKIDNQVNIPCDIGWSDLGSWDDISKIAETKPIRSSVDQREWGAKNCFTHSDQKKMICLSGVEDLIVVDTDDALLITKKGQSQDVKKIVEDLKSQSSTKISDHTFEHRPWGFYRNLYEEKNYKTKVITVDPGQQLSYQSHTKRSEIWITVEGLGEVVLNDEVIPVEPGKIVRVPVGAKHRMRNPSSEPLKFVEVQLGDYFGEDDITRYEDDYKRV